MNFGIIFAIENILRFLVLCTRAIVTESLTLQKRIKCVRSTYISFACFVPHFTIKTKSAIQFNIIRKHFRKSSFIPLYLAQTQSIRTCLYVNRCKMNAQFAKQTYFIRRVKAISPPLTNSTTKKELCRLAGCFCLHRLLLFAFILASSSDSRPILSS